MDALKTKVTCSLSIVLPDYSGWFLSVALGWLTFAPSNLARASCWQIDLREFCGGDTGKWLIFATHRMLHNGLNKAHNLRESERPEIDFRRPGLVKNRSPATRFRVER